MTGKRERVLWILVVLVLSFVAALSWVRWGGGLSAGSRSAEERLAVYLADESRSTRFSERRTDPLGLEVYSEPQPILTADHFASCVRHERGASFEIELQPTEAGRKILAARDEQYRSRYLVIVLNGEVIAQSWHGVAPAATGGALTGLTLAPVGLGYAEPSRPRMEELLVQVQNALNPAGS